MKHSHLFLLIVFLLSPCLISADTDAMIQCLEVSKIPKPQLMQLVKKPDSNDYGSILRAYTRNLRFTGKPDLILAPWEEQHIPEIVKCAKQAGVMLRIRSGGHDYEGLSYTNRGLSSHFVILDLFGLRSVEVNLSDESVWVQAGAMIGEFYYKIWEKSKVHAFPAAVCLTLGAGGHISGGGYGNLMRKYGLSIDNMVDAKIVDSQGRLLDRKSMGEDLFWAIRGGGGASFGVILSYKLKLVRIPPSVTVFAVVRTQQQNATDLIYQWQQFADKVDEDLFLRATIQPMKEVRSFNVTFVAMYLGDVNNLVSLVNKNMPGLGLKRSDCQEMSWVKSTLFWAEYPKGTPETALLNRTVRYKTRAFKMKSDYVRTPIPRDALAKVMERLAVSENVSMMFNPYGGKMAKILDSATAYPYRAGNSYLIQYLLYWDNNTQEKLHLNNLMRFHEFMTPYVSRTPRQAFQNYRDLDIGANGAAYFGKNFERLVQVKTRVDPDNFFRHEQSIPPTPASARSLNHNITMIKKEGF